MKVLVSLLLIAISSAVAVIHYDGFKVLRVVPKTFRAKERFAILKQDLRVLKVLPAGEHAAYDVIISPDNFNTFQSHMNQFNIEFTIQIEDVQKLIENQKELNEIAKTKRRPRPSSRIDHSYYRTFEEINAELENFVIIYPTLMSKSSIGKSYEGRDLNMIKVSSGGDDSKEVIWISCGIHAREWIAPASCLFFLDSLSTYGSDSEITSLLDTYDFFILTCVNPDGYDFTWTGDRMWRKNRFPTTEDSCPGIDINRNFDSNFGGVGTSNHPCSESYHGEFAFSEFESQAIRDAINAENGRIKMLNTLHSYSQLWMYAYGYTFAQASDHDELDRVAAIGVDALESVYGTEYRYGPISTTIYEASGNTVDWAYDSAGVIYSYTLELSDTGEYGFILPPHQIEPTATETWEGLKATINAI